MFHDKIFVRGHSRFSKPNNFTNNTIHCLPSYDAAACNMNQLLTNYKIDEASSEASSDLPS
jgi:hypothetical protein